MPPRNNAAFKPPNVRITVGQRTKKAEPAQPDVPPAVHLPVTQTMLQNARAVEISASYFSEMHASWGFLASDLKGGLSNTNMDKYVDLVYAKDTSYLQLVLLPKTSAEGQDSSLLGGQNDLLGNTGLSESEDDEEDFDLTNISQLRVGDSSKNLFKATVMGLVLPMHLCEELPEDGKDEDSRIPMASYSRRGDLEEQISFYVLTDKTVELDRTACLKLEPGINHVKISTVNFYMLHKPYRVPTDEQMTQSMTAQGEQRSTPSIFFPFPF